MGGRRRKGKTVEVFFVKRCLRRRQGIEYEKKAIGSSHDTHAGDDSFYYAQLAFLLSTLSPPLQTLSTPH